MDKRIAVCSGRRCPDRGELCASGDPGRNFGMTSAANNSSEVPWTPAYSELTYCLG